MGDYGLASKKVENSYGILTAEFWAKGAAETNVYQKYTPFRNFKFNILKARILAASAQVISKIWPEVHDKIYPQDIDEINDLQTLLHSLFEFFESGLASYYVYTEQALVTAVTASETYLKNRLASIIQNDKRILKQFLDKEIKVKRILDLKFDLKDDIGKLIVEDNDFQKIDNVEKIYKNKLSVELFTKKEKMILKRIFSIRHLIVHRSGIIDQTFISEMGIDCKIGTRICYERDEILRMIKFIDELVTNIESNIFSKFEM
jgi:hypothetical protein